MIETFDIPILEAGISHLHGSKLPTLRSTKVLTRSLSTDVEVTLGKGGASDTCCFFWNRTNMVEQKKSDNYHLTLCKHPECQQIATELYYHTKNMDWEQRCSAHVEQCLESSRYVYYGSSEPGWVDLSQNLPSE